MTAPNAPEELFDVLDKNGNPTGRQKAKLEIIKAGDWRKVTHVWVVNAHEEVVVQQRVQKGHGLWDDLWDVSVGGGVSAGEDSKHAATRELGEELGIEAEESELENLGRWETTKALQGSTRLAREFSDTYLLRRKVELSGLSLQSEEVADVELIPLDQLVSIVNDEEQYKNWVPHPKQYYLGVIALIKGLPKA